MLIKEKGLGRRRLFAVRLWTISTVLLALIFLSGSLAAERVRKMSQETMNKNRHQIRITTVRYDERTGCELLQNYIFGGIRTTPRVPRGIDPELVSRFIEENLKPDSPSGAYAKTVQVLRFYERGDCLSHLRRVLSGQERSLDDIYRSAYVIQAVADIGNQKEADEVAQYFDAYLASHPKAFEAVDVLLETLVVLSPSGSAQQLSKRIADEVNTRKTAENQSEEGMRAYQKVAAIQRLKLPRALAAAGVKKKLLAMDPAQRLPELIGIYMGTSSVSDDLMMTWAARILRRMAMESDPNPIYEGLGKEISKVDLGKVGKESMTDTIVSRAAQATLYLQGKLTKTQRELYEKAKLGAMNFLWDDLGQ